jgi:TonB-linked SusC/RagA family outer membrane protein
MKKILQLWMVPLFVFAAASAMAQGRVVTGKVTSSEDRGTMPGVNVLVKGTTTGTVTDTNGAYSLSAEPGSTLVFSFIGFVSKEIAIGDRTSIDVELNSDVTQLSEVVVTAVGIERQSKALGYSVERVKGDKLQQVSEPDPLRALQGKIAGVNIQSSSGAPGSSTRITIRGNNSLLGNNQPLFVVDGIPYNNEQGGGQQNSITGPQNQLTGGGAYGSRFSDLDPNNIESMTVLKGAAAAALYGTRASNGVILITTKTGASRASRKGLEITYNSSFSMENVANLPEYQNKYGTGTNFNYAQANGSWGAPFIGAQPYATLDSIANWQNGVAGFESVWGKKVPYRAYPNNVKDFFNTGNILENSLSISGGNEKANLTLVISKMDQNGIVPETKFGRTNVSLGGNMKLDNGLYVGGNLSYTNNVQHTFQGGASSAIGNSSAFGRTLYLGRNWDLQGQPYQNPLTKGSAFFIPTASSDNPYWSTKNAGIDTNTDRYVASFNLGYDIKEWLNLSYKLGINGYTQRQTDYFRPGSRGAGGAGQVSNFDVTFQEIESNLLATVTRDVAKDLNLKLIVGNNINQRTTYSQGYVGTGYVTFDIDNIINTNSVVPNGGGFSRRRIIGAFGDLTLGYKNYLFLSATGRNDWSSTLPIQNNSFFYSSVSSSIVFTEALGLSSKILNYGKLRAAFSQVGNDTGPYNISQTYGVNANSAVTLNGPNVAFPFRGVPGSSLEDVLRNPNLKPERTQEVELGLELKLFNKIGIDLTVYDKRTRDQIVFINVPQTSGFNQFLTNIGEVSNRGIELGLNVTPISLNNGFNWNMYGTFTLNRNKIESLIEGTDEIVLRNTFAGSAQAVHQVGQPYGLIKGSKAVRDTNGNLLINPADGTLITDPNPKVIGNPNPDFIVGLTNTFSWKGFALSSVFDWKQGGSLYSVTTQQMMSRGVTRDTENREVPLIIPGVYGNPNSLLPILGSDGSPIKNTTAIEVNALYFGNSFAGNGLEEFSVYDATVFRLREVTLGYSIPKKVLSKTPFGSARISLSGRNLWYIAPNFPKYTNFDPETNTFGNSNAQGFEFASQPSVRRYGVNISLTF